MSAHFRRVRAAVDEHGRGAGRQEALDQLDDLTHRVPLIHQMATRNFDDVLDVLRKGRSVDEAADTSHARFADADSDFLGYLNLWRYVKEQQQELSPADQ